MSWISKLYETYENCQSEVGRQIEGQTTLLPIAHSTQNAQIEVVLDAQGNYLRAKIVEKADAVTIIPVTEDSAARGNGNMPHPLCDKLIYTAADYAQYAGKKKSEEYHQNYIDRLEQWCSSPYANAKVNAVFMYLQKGTLISDLIKNKILFCGQDNGLLEKWEGDKNNAPAIFKVSNAMQSDAFVRFRVEAPNDLQSAVWLDKAVWDSWIQFYLSRTAQTDLCFVTGEYRTSTEKHPAKIRNTADKAKLISANDTSNFTFRGRFRDKDQAVSVSYEVSQKAHTALRWLIGKQGYQNGDQSIVAWGTHNQIIPPVWDDTEDLLSDKDEAEPVIVTTEQEFAQRLNKAIAGYRQNLDHSSEIVVLGLDSATTGRLSITYYRELQGDEYLERVQKWHETCAWKHTYKKAVDGVDKNGKDRLKSIAFIGAPSPKDIALAAYGKEVNDKLKKATIERLLPCIIDGAKLPSDLVLSAVQRASNPVAIEQWEWNKTLSIACALYCKLKEKENFQMALEENNTDRNYLYGRLLAIADQIENMAYDKWGERPTNAMRYMNMFSQRPFKTWQIIAERLNPYEMKLGNKCSRYRNLISEICTLFQFGDYTSDTSLNGAYLLGFHCQRQVFWDEMKEREAKKAQEKLSTKE